MRRPPFEWTASDRKRLKPGCPVVCVRESYPPGSGIFSVSLQIVVKIYEDTVFFRSGLSGMSMGFEPPQFYGEKIENLDPKSLPGAEEDAEPEPDENADDAEPGAVH
jgi:hypothetical protein